MTTNSVTITYGVKRSRDYQSVDISMTMIITPSEGESAIGYSIHKAEPLDGLEEQFAAMKKVGVPATERIPSGQFWAMTRRRLQGNFQPAFFQPALLLEVN